LVDKNNNKNYITDPDCIRISGSIDANKNGTPQKRKQKLCFEKLCGGLEAFA
jgi:hypothetical protein